MDWSEQGRKIKGRGRTVVASDKKGDNFVGVCVHALVGSLVPTENTLVWSEGPMRIMAERLESCRVGVGHPISDTNHGWNSPVWVAWRTYRGPPCSLTIHFAFCESFPCGRKILIFGTEQTQI